MNFKDFNDYLKQNQSTQPLDVKPTELYASCAPVDLDAAIVPPIINQNKLNTILDTKIVAIDSRDRDTTRFPNSNRFQLSSNSLAVNTLEEHIKNVRHIKLEECVLPDFTDDHPYLILRIHELPDNIRGTNNSLRTAFAILVPERINGDYVTCKTSMTALCQRTYNPPISLKTLTMEFLTPPIAGVETLYDFPNNNETLTVLQFCYEIPDITQLNYQLIP